jgi:hypothetical protein
LERALQASLRFTTGAVGVAALGAVLALVSLQIVDPDPVVYAVPGPRPHYQDMPRSGQQQQRRSPEQIVRQMSHGRFVDVLERQTRERSGWARRDNPSQGGK